MTRLQLLRKARTNYTVAFSQFIKAYSKNPNRLFCFFEGYDSKYYSVRINILVGTNNWANMNCRNRDGVIHLYDLISGNPQYKDAKVAYFLDRDYGLDQTPQNSFVYVTPCYSVENFYVTKSAFENILKNELQLSELQNHGDFNRILKLYVKLLNRFNSTTEELNAWIYLNVKDQLLGLKKSKLNLDSINLNKLVEIKLSKISKKYTLKSLSKTFPNSNIYLTKEVKNTINNFGDVDRCQIFRGKYLIEFVRVFISLLKLDATIGSPKYIKNNKTIFINISKNNILSELSQFADTPPCLSNFLKVIRTRANQN